MQHKFDDLDKLYNVLEKIIDHHLKSVNGIMDSDLNVNLDQEGSIIPILQGNKVVGDIVAIFELIKNNAKKKEFDSRGSEDSFCETSIYIIRLDEVLLWMRDDIIDNLLEED
tara:strand:- start:250 stop:585 length:336 start_codon:yes stop_codon:yes gene_type:complete